MTNLQTNIRTLRNISLFAGLQAGLIVPMGMQLSKIDWYSSPVVFGAVIFAALSNAGFALFLFFCSERLAKKIEAQQLPAPASEVQLAILSSARNEKMRIGGAIFQIVLGGAWIGTDISMKSWSSDIYLGAFFVVMGAWELWNLYRGRA